MRPEPFTRSDTDYAATSKYLISSGGERISDERDPQKDFLSSYVTKPALSLSPKIHNTPVAQTPGNFPPFRACNCFQEFWFEELWTNTETVTLACFEQGSFAKYFSFQPQLMRTNRVFFFSKSSSFVWNYLKKIYIRNKKGWHSAACSKCVQALCQA